MALAVSHCHDLGNLPPFSSNVADAGVDELVAYAFEFHSLRVRRDVMLEAKRRYDNWLVY